jgi:hypothetical protein
MGKLMSESCSRVLTAVCIASSVLLFSVGCASDGGSGWVPENTHATLLSTPPAGLPFTPTLNAESILPGQNVATPIEALQSAGNIVPVTSVVTLEPQTINGMVAAISSVNGQAAYQITLFNDDLIALFASRQTVVAYSTAETHTITTSPLSVGATARVRGLLFNDGGTLRMVATEIEDGVPGS